MGTVISHTLCMVNISFIQLGHCLFVFTYTNMVICSLSVFICLHWLFLWLFFKFLFSLKQNLKIWCEAFPYRNQMMKQGFFLLDLILSINTHAYIYCSHLHTFLMLRIFDPQHFPIILFVYFYTLYTSQTSVSLCHIGLSH